MQYTDSILTSVKQYLGLGPGYDHFDGPIIANINTAFRALHQLGVGPNIPFSIRSADETWFDFIPDENLNDVRDYVNMRVKLLFDPPQSSFLVELLKDQIKELEWRLNVGAEEFE